MKFKERNRNFICAWANLCAKQMKCIVLPFGCHGKCFWKLYGMNIFPHFAGMKIARWIVIVTTFQSPFHLPYYRITQFTWAQTMNDQPNDWVMIIWRDLPLRLNLTHNRFLKKSQVSCRRKILLCIHLLNIPLENEKEFSKSTEQLEVF